MEYTGQRYICLHCMGKKCINKHRRVCGVSMKRYGNVQECFRVLSSQICQNHVVVYEVRQLFC